MVAVSSYMGGTRGSGILSSACHMLEMSVVIGVGGVCDMCMCLSRGGCEVLDVGCEWVTGLGLCLGQSLGWWGGVMSVCVVSG